MATKIAAIADADIFFTPFHIFQLAPFLSLEQIDAAPSVMLEL
ncbi:MULTISPECIES: hypothetical protein [unclassified Paraeggerthella]|nr:hypothetical protein [Paraeggerthella sp. Marseille-Q4926]MDY3980604.1 hypothetical protein [Paraeggerthella sp.]